MNIGHPILYLIMLAAFCHAAESTNEVAAAASNGQSENPDVVFIDRMEFAKNLLDGRCATYRMAPDEILYSKGPAFGREGGGLKLMYRKVNVEGPYGQGGWIGYYTTLKRGGKYFDASRFTHLTFWVKGEKGGERFKIGMADKQLGLMEDSAKSGPIENYLPEKKITTEWQRAMIPLNDMFVDYNLVDSISISFEADLFEDERSEGTVYIDDLAFEKIEASAKKDQAPNRSERENGPPAGDGK